MLLRRILTALTLIPLVVAGVLYLPDSYLALILAVVVLLGGWEWTRLAMVESVVGRVLFLGLLGLLLVAGWLLLLEMPWSTLWVSSIASLWWLLVTLMLIRYRPGSAMAASPLKLLYGVMVLFPPWFSLLAIHRLPEDGPLLVLFIMVLIWVADTGAYFSGRRFGRVKLAPHISPGKTREGVYGALLGAVLCGLLLYQLRPQTGALALLILFCLLLALVSVVGDLFESLLKRQAGLKDSGQLLPGHGGMLDRIDSLTAAAPVYLLGLLLLRVEQ